MVSKSREKNGETILFWHRGLSLSDIALGHKILSKAKEIEAKTQICLMIYKFSNKRIKLNHF